MSQKDRILEEINQETREWAEKKLAQARARAPKVALTAAAIAFALGLALGGWLF